MRTESYGQARAKVNREYAKHPANLPVVFIVPTVANKAQSFALSCWQAAVFKRLLTKQQAYTQSDKPVSGAFNVQFVWNDWEV